jgi:hypothetical protein
VENIGTDSAKSAKLSLTLPEGVTGKRTAFLGTITKDSASTANFSLKAEKKIAVGHHDISVLIEYDDPAGKNYNKTSTVDLFIQDRGDVKLSISNINTSPSKIYPNTDFTLSLGLENTGTQDARAAKMVLMFPREFTGEDSAFYGKIPEGGSSSTSFDLKALKSSGPGKYTATAKITFTDELGIADAVEEQFSLFILDRGEVILEISGKSTSPTNLVPGTEFTLSLQLENIGDQDAKSVRIDLESNGDLIGEFTSFVGEIEKDDVSTGVFDLRVSPIAEPGTRMISAKVTYLDERGIENTAIKSFDLFIGEPSGRSNTTIILVAVVVIVLVIYLWRRRKSEYTET